MKSNNFKHFLAQKFDKKKTIQNDVIRIKNIHKKPFFKINSVKIDDTTKIDHTSKIDKTFNEQTIYQFDNLTSNNIINLNISRENDTHKIPKIVLKETSIPSYYDNDNFDLNKINQNISIPINMDIFISDPIGDDIVYILKKLKILKINHVYQEKYADDILPTGFGDFIRSCFFIHQFSNKYGFKYEIVINHPIALFLDNFINKYIPNSISSTLLNNKVHMFTETNWNNSVFDSNNYIQSFNINKIKFNNYIHYLSSQQIINHSVFSYNIFFPYDIISIDDCNKIRSIFQPSKEMSEFVDLNISNLDLIKNKFIVVHIRSGDSYLKGETQFFYSLYFEIIKNEISQIIFNNKKCDILLIADNNEIKRLLKDSFTNIKTIYNEITHLGEGIELDISKVKNTLLDFYLMSHSNYIYSFTSYPHGSGFSYWCSKMYDIPYKCKYIKVT